MKQLDLNNVGAMNFLCCNELEPTLWLCSCCSLLACCSVVVLLLGAGTWSPHMVLRCLVQVQIFNVGVGVQLCGNEEC
jgi:hypothetical protein